MEKDQRSPLPSFSPMYVLVVVAFLSNAAVVVFFALNFSNTGGVLFSSSFQVIHAKYITELSPHPSAVLIVGTITFIWSTAVLVYFLVSLCLPHEQSPVLTNPTLTPKTFLISFAVSNIFLVGWLFMFDREQLVFAFAFQLIACVSLWKSIGISLVAVCDNASEIILKNDAMLWLMRILVHNGLILFAVNLTGFVVLGFGMILIYEDSYGASTAQLKGGFSVQDGSTMTLAGFLVLVLMFIIMEMSAYRRYFRYTVCTSLGFVAFLAGIVAQLHQVGNIGRNFLISTAALGACMGWLIIKLISFTGQFQTSSTRGWMHFYRSKPSDKSVLIKM